MIRSLMLNQCKYTLLYFYTFRQGERERRRERKQLGYQLLSASQDSKFLKLLSLMLLLSSSQLHCSSATFSTIKLKNRTKDLKTEIKQNRHTSTSMCKIKTGKKKNHPNLKASQMVQDAIGIMICYFIEISNGSKREAKL